MDHIKGSSSKIGWHPLVRVRPAGSSSLRLGFEMFDGTADTAVLSA